MSKQIGKIDTDIVIDAVAKSALGFVPYIGSFLGEIVTYRSQVKQKRLLKFVELVGQCIEAAGGIDSSELGNLDKEEIGDLLESVVRRVIQTRTEEKVQRFAQILVNHLKTPVGDDYSETFLDLITQLSEKQLEILHTFSTGGNQYKIRKQARVLKSRLINLEEQSKKEYDRHSQGFANNYSSNMREVEQVKAELAGLEDQITTNDATQAGEYYGIGRDQYQFMIQDLYSKSLLIDIGIGGIGIEPFQIMSITSLGRELLHFVRASGNTTNL